MYQRGDIVLVDNPYVEAHGHIMCGNHPAVVIQNNVGNEYSDNLIVVYLSSKLKKLHLPTHVVLQWYEGLRKTSVVQAEQIATVSKSDVISLMDHLRPEDMARVDRAVAVSLALGRCLMPLINHSLLGASSASRWMACTPSARLTEELEEYASTFAEEGTAAHELCEWKVRKALKKRAGKRPTSDYWTDEMEKCSDAYRDFVMELVRESGKECPDPLILIEQHVDYSAYAPSGYGTCDFLIVADKVLHVVDFKYGKGIPVSADYNPQMMLYALGGYLAFSCLYDIEMVRMTIYQPRLYNVSTFEMKIEDLLNWAEQDVKPRAELAFKGEGDFIPGEYCRFCKAKDTCRARADEFLKMAQMEFRPAPLLSDEEIAVVLGQASELSKWVSDIMAYAQAEAIEKGTHFDGYKLVEGRSLRKFTSEDDVIKASTDAGYTDIYEKKLISLTGFEKMMGKKEFQNILGQFVTKPKGKLTLVPVSDKRPEVTVNQVEQDFKE